MIVNTHFQVPFVTKTGELTSVDEGLLTTMLVLRLLSVGTQFSCQGDDFGGYICADTESFRPVILRAVDKYKRGKLTDESLVFMHDFMLKAEIEVRTGVYVPKVRWLSKEEKDSVERYAYERTTRQPNFGDRTTVRWPTHRLVEFENLVLELA